MFRTCVICCALAGAVGLTIGVQLEGHQAHVSKDESLKSYKTKLAPSTSRWTKLKAKADKATAKRRRSWSEVEGRGRKRDAAKKKLEEAGEGRGRQVGCGGEGSEGAFDEATKAVKE